MMEEEGRPVEDFIIVARRQRSPIVLDILSFLVGCVIFWTIAGLVGSREKGLEHIMVEFHFWRKRDAVS
jgi:hypothetical protein